MNYSVTPLRQLARLYGAVLRTAATTHRLAESQDRLAASLQDRIRPIDHRRPSSDCSSVTAALLRQLLDRANSLSTRQAALSAQSVSQELAELRAGVAIVQSDNVVLQGWSSYSQCDEDGIIRECLRRIGRQTTLSRTFVEIGCADGLENNTHQLLLDGFRGCWLDGDAAKIGFVEGELGTLRSESLWVVQAFASLDNIGRLTTDFIQHLRTPEIDFLSLDIDGNDTHLMQVALQLLRPKLICVEYNAKFPPPTRMSMAYRADHQWAGNDFFGATLQAWIEHLEGYRLVSCNLSGVNAFFVREDLVKAFTLYDATELFQPRRYWLAGAQGHPASLRWLRQILAERQC